MEFAFYFSAGVAVAATLMVITNTRAVHALLYLVISLLAVSMCFFSLGAPFAGVLEIIVYAGAIMVLFLFVIMLMNLNRETEPQKNRWLKIAGGIAAGCLMLVMVAALKDAGLKNEQAMIVGGNIGLIKNLGRELFTTYVVPFEISSILFLSAMVGAVVIGKKE